MKTKAIYLLGIFFVVVMANVGLQRVLSGGSDAGLILAAAEQLSEDRSFVGTVSLTLPEDGSLEQFGELSVIKAAGRFGFPVGGPLVGAWRVYDSQNAAGDMPIMEMTVTEDGSFYLRDDGADALGLMVGLDLESGTWLELNPQLLWGASVGRGDLDAPALWNELFAVVRDGSELHLRGRALSQNVGGEATWHLLLGLSERGTYSLLRATHELRSGRPVTDAEADRLWQLARIAEPTVDVWVSKATGKFKQIAATFNVAGPGDDLLHPQVAVVSVAFVEFPEWETIKPPEGAVKLEIVDQADFEGMAGAAPEDAEPPRLP
jgi:hypothetical protein